MGWVSHGTFSSINTPKNLVDVSRSRVLPSMDSSSNIVGITTGVKYSQFGFININREFVLNQTEAPFSSSIIVV